MPVQAIAQVARAQNGIGAFVLPCRRLDFHYSDWHGSSRGMNSFLKHILPGFARSNPGIEIHVSPVPHKHPMVKAHYTNGKFRMANVKNLEIEQILQKVEGLRDSSGHKPVRQTKPVTSVNESVRGIWSPFHVTEGAWKI